MRVLIVLAAIALAGGCSHATIDASVNATAGGVPPPGASVHGGSVGLHVHSHSLAALVVAGMFVAAAAEYSSEPRPMPDFSSLADWFRGAPPPKEPAPGRAIVEHDCTKPLPELSGPLRCR